jgi:signal transduction histidine kinase
VGLVSTLRNYVMSWSDRFKLCADFQAVNLEGERLAPEIETAFYRLLQEALTNVIKHAQAKSVSVVLECFDGQVQMIIEDDGCGFDADAALNTVARQGRLGLSGMKERLALVGGVLAIESNADSGTTVFARIPLPKR